MAREFESQTAESKPFDSSRDGVAHVEERNCRVQVCIAGGICRCGGAGCGGGEAVD